MLKPATLSGATLRLLATQLSTQPSDLSRESIQAGIKVELAETFEVYEFALDPPPPIGIRPRSIVKPTGQWHHQIRHGSEAREFALSVSRGPGAQDHAIELTFTSEIAQQIDVAIEWVDRNTNQVPDGVVNLLFIAPLLMHAFWIETLDSDFVVLIDLPGAQRSVQREVFYGSDDFVRIVTSIPRNNGFSDLPPPGSGEPP